MDAHRPPARIIHASIALLFTAALAFCPAIAQAPAPSDQKPVQLAAGVLYRHLERKSAAGEPWSIHVLEIDRGEQHAALRSVVALNAQGHMERELPTELAARAAREGVEVVAVVNADFDLGAPYLGIPTGLAVTAGVLWSTPKPDWPELGQLADGEPVIGLPTVEIELRTGKQSWQVASVNKPMGFMAGDAPRLYTGAFGAWVKSDKRFRALVIEKLSPALPLRSAGVVRGRVAKAIDVTSEVAIPSGSLVFAFPAPHPQSAGAAAPMSMVALPKPGARVTLRVRAGIAGRAPVVDAAGGSHIVVRNAWRTIEGPHSENLLLRHPRTAACYNDREWIFVVVDGRQPFLSAGMTLDELGELMVSLGCSEAINLDGGGSSMMAVAFPGTDPAPGRLGPLRIVNSPSDGKERGRGNAWLIVRK